MFNFKSILYVMGLWAAVCLPALAVDNAVSTIYLKDGSTIIGKVIKDHSDMLIIESEGKNKSVIKSDIKRVARDDNYAPVLTKAYESESAGKFGEAMETYHSILAKDPEHKEAGEGKARMMQAIPFEFKKRYNQFYQAKAYDRILQHLQNEISGMMVDSPQREAMKIVESEIYTFMGQEKMKRLVYEQAEQDFRRALRLNPRNFTAALMLGDLFTATSRWEDAYNILRDVAVEMPDNLIATGLLMQSAFHTRHFEHGMEIYENLGRRENLSLQEKRFVDLCINDCSALIAEARGLPYTAVTDDAVTSGPESMTPMADDAGTSGTEKNKTADEIDKIP